MIPHVIVLEPGLVIYKIYNGYWFPGRPTLEDLRQPSQISAMGTIRFSEAESGSLSKREALVRSPS